MNSTFLFGIDGATFTVLDHLIGTGRLPNFRRLLDHGVRAELMSTPHPLTPPAWTTLMTGKNPGSHGIFDFIWSEGRDGSHYFTLNNFTDIRTETIWSMVSRQGGTSTVLNFPFLSPPPDIRATIVPGLVSWKHLRRNCQPGDLFSRLETIPGFDIKKAAWDFDREKRATQALPDEGYEEWVTVHIEREKQWIEMCRYFMGQQPADLTAILLDGTDKIQHVCWRHLDPACQEELSEEDRRIRDMCLAFFDLVDAFLGDVIDSLGPEGRILVASDHGFGPTRNVFRINRWLAENGYLSWPEIDHLDADEQEKFRKLATGHFIHVDWQKTRACVPSAATNGIYVVPAGEGEGGVPAEEYDTFCHELTEKLLAIRDPEGNPVVVEVLHKRDAFPGPHNERCPDLTVILSDHGFVSTLPDEPTFFSRPQIVGTHRPEGVFMAMGPGIRSGVRLPRQSITDITPTMLYSLGADIPADLDGRVILEAFETSYQEAHPVCVRGTTQLASGEESDAGMEQEDEDAVMARLRALGYVE